MMVAASCAQTEKKQVTENQVIETIMARRSIRKYKQAMEMLANKELDLVINIPKNFSHRELTNGYHVRRAAIDFNIPLITNARLATAFIRAFCAMSIDDIQIKSWDQY